MTPANKAYLQADASNRSLRTFLQGLAIDVAVGLALVLITFIGPLNDWGDVQWTILSFSLSKSVVQAISAFVLRRFLDGKIPTPLPPAPAGEPVDRDPLT